MKQLRKEQLLNMNLIEKTIQEKEILLKVKYPFLVNMNFVFQTQLKVYFVMRFCRGGELHRHLK